MKVGILGYGTLGRAIGNGLAEHPHVEGVRGTTRSGGESNRALAAESDVLILCVKPHQAASVIAEIVPELGAEHVLISAAASVSIAQLHRWSDERCAVVRVMPNTPARVRAGMTVIAKHEKTPQSAALIAESLFSTLGRVAYVDESLFDAATAISGCGPAYVFLIIEALRDAGVRLGLPRDTALLLAAQTLLGSAAMLLQADEHPAALKDDVTTPAGCTIDALLVLEDGKLRSTIMRAAIAAAERSAVLGQTAPH